MNCGRVCVVLVLVLDLVLLPFLRRVRSRILCGLVVLFLVLSPVAVLFLIVGGFYSEVAFRNEKQKAQCILNTS